MFDASILSRVPKATQAPNSAETMGYLTRPVNAKKEVAQRVKALLWAKGFPI